MKILKQVDLEGVTRKKDKTITLRFTTSLEQTSEQLMELDKVLDTSGILYYKAHGEINSEELKELDGLDIEIAGKTESQRLRNAIYVLHKKSGDNRSIEEFYKYQMNKFRTHITDQIPED